MATVRLEGDEVDGPMPLQMQDSRRSVNSFIAKYDDTCTRCHLPIEAGERVRYVDGGIVHHRHKHVEPVVEICPQCWLTKPCDC